MKKICSLLVLFFALSFTQSAQAFFDVRLTGLEAGVKLIGFTLGAELGYMGFQWNDCNDSAANSSTRDINMSGTYGKLVLGFSI